MSSNKKLSEEQHNALIQTIKSRFEKNMKRHQGLIWSKVQAKLETDSKKIWSLNEMEQSGGEPDVVAYDPKTDTYTFFDCSAESPAGRRSLCYDREGLESRKEFKPKNTAIDMANEMGIELLNEEQYMALQKLGSFDTKTSSWILTPDAIRKHGGALFADFRFGKVFVYHNTAPSYYAARGFRGCLKV